MDIYACWWLVPFLSNIVFIFQTVQDATMNPNNLVTGTKAFRLNVTFPMRTEECMMGYTTEHGRMKTMIHLFMKAFNIDVFNHFCFDYVTFHIFTKQIVI